MDVSVIIVNYNVKFYLENCLISVQKAIGRLQVEVIVFDNNSTDGSVDFLERYFPWVKFIRSDVNLGFAKANNKALELAQGEFILFLNPDTVVPEDSLSRCVQVMHKDPAAGALGVRMIDGRGRYLRESKRGFPSAPAAFFKLTGLARLFPRSKTFARYYLGHLPKHRPHEIEVLSGAYFFVRKRILQQIGSFDERFFMYGEDIDLSYRIHAAGYKNLYFPQIIIIHYKGESTRKDFKYVKQFYLAMSQFVEKHYSGKRQLFRFILKCGIAARSVPAMFGRLVPSRQRKLSNQLQFEGDHMGKALAERIMQSVPKRPTSYQFPVFVFCEGIGVPIKVIIRFMKKHPGRYLLYLKGSHSVIGGGMVFSNWK